MNTVPVFRVIVALAILVFGVIFAVTFFLLLQAHQRIDQLEHDIVVGRQNRESLKRQVFEQGMMIGSLKTMKKLTQENSNGSPPPE